MATRGPLELVEGVYILQNHHTSLTTAQRYLEYLRSTHIPADTAS